MFLKTCSEGIIKNMITLCIVSSLSYLLPVAITFYSFCYNKIKLELRIEMLELSTKMM